jgi:hypothetical protein
MDLRIAFFALYCVGAFGFFTGNIELPHSFEWFLGILALLCAVLVFLPREIITRSPKLRAITDSEITRIELIINIALVLSWIGSLKFYTAGFGYDSFVHFTNSLIAPLAIIAPLQHHHTHLKKRSIFITLFILTLAIGFGIEFFELLGDIVIGTAMSGELAQANDTLRDIIYDALGALIGAGIATTLFSKK